MAKRAGLANSFLSMIERGSCPAMPRLWRIAKAFDLRTSALLAEAEARTDPQTAQASVAGEPMPIGAAGFSLAALGMAIRRRQDGLARRPGCRELAISAIDAGQWPALPRLICVAAGLEVPLSVLVAEAEELVAPPGPEPT
jgi:hypothetical protein